MITEEELKKLRAVARAATGGTWIYNFCNSEPIVSLDEFDATHISTFDPPKVNELLDEIERLRELCEKLRREAEMHAQEARTQKSTVHECYQAVSGGTGEPGDWNGAQPIRDYVAAKNARLREALERIRCGLKTIPCQYDREVQNIVDLTPEEFREIARAGLEASS
ncbi:hypothetical protein [uncultured Planktomarina sp.]|jgi:hypothetical protein|uniref:hypothetical protein n=1 Tax=uncultured Planktomarina sp. TaxID=1538529 RepID=UPI00326056FA